MADGKVLEFRGVTKIFGDVAAVSDFSARIEPGVVTGFVGPNGAGKSTTLRILLGDIAPTQGSALIDGVVYKKLTNPRRTVGALLENTPYKPRRTAERHLILAARAIGVPVSRVDEVLEVVGLAGVGHMRIGGYSLGMRQRLGVAEALLGDPDVLVFDEPANGLDPEGIRWMRLLMRRLADEGRTVLMSSHVLSEVQQVADNILVISNGRLLFSGGIEQLADAEQIVAVDSPQRGALRDLLRENGYEFELLRSGINVLGATPGEIGELAAQAGVPLSALQAKQPNLEDVYLKIVNGTWQGPSSDDKGDEAEADAPAGVPPMPATVVADESSADPEPVTPPAEDLPFAPVAAEAVAAPADEVQPVATVLGSATATAHDPLAFLKRSVPDTEKDVAAGEAALIAASPEGEQPTAGWVPTPEPVPSPAEEDADDPDQLETADEVIELPGDEDDDAAQDAEGEPAEFADAGGIEAVTAAEAGTDFEVEADADFEDEVAATPEATTEADAEFEPATDLEAETAADFEAESDADFEAQDASDADFAAEDEVEPIADELAEPDEVAGESVELDEQELVAWDLAHETETDDDADHPDALETADEVIEISDDGEPEGEADATPEDVEELEQLDPIDNEAHDDADEDDVLETADETIEVSGDAAAPAEPADGETDELLEVAAESAENEGAALPEVHASVDELKPRPKPIWPGLAEWKQSREHTD